MKIDLLKRTFCKLKNVGKKPKEKRIFNKQTK